VAAGPQVEQVVSAHHLRVINASAILRDEAMGIQWECIS
jgi:hypothetical protein